MPKLSVLASYKLARHTPILRLILWGGVFACLIFAVSSLSFGVKTMGAMAAERPDSFADLAENLSPSVVNISTTTVVESRPRSDIPNFPEGTPFEDFFREFQDRGGRPRRAQSLGSGFIIDASGIVVTNNHVIENADEISVTLANDESFEAKLIGRDQKTDIAVLKIDPGKTKLKAVSFGDSDNLRVGDWVVAIGNPFGLGGTVTVGIVSARGRDIGSGPYDDFIQTDASINKGNSGGPLFNIKGEVIGINTAIFSQSGGSVGIGFAISANLATEIVKQLQEFGRTRRGWLGVFIQEVTDDIADSLGLDRAHGALVASVTETGPAEKAGIEAGDVIIKFDGQDIERSRDLPRIVAKTAVDRTVKVLILRNGKQRSLKVKLGELEQAESGGLLPSSGEQPNEIDDIGLSVAPLSNAWAKTYDLKSDPQVVIVVEVKKGSPAEARGINEGDIIRRLNQTAISSVQQLIDGIKAAKDSGRKSVLMLVESDGQTRFVSISFDEDG